MKKISWHELKPQVKEVWVLSLPAILTQITTIVMQYIDSAMVGSLGANASAAIGLVSTSTWLLGGITYAVSAGFSVQVAHNIGAGRDAEARSVVRHGLCTALCVAGILCALGLSIHSMLPTWLGGDPAIRYDASKYFMVYALMIPFSQIHIGALEYADFDLSDEEVLTEMRRGGWVIVEGKNCTEFGIGRAAAYMAGVILRDEKKILPASVNLHGEYGEHDVQIGVPCVIGAEGIERVLEIPLTEEEKSQFHHSCDVVRGNIAIAAAK